MNGTPKYGINDCVKQLAYTIDAQRGTTFVTEEWIGPTDTIESLATTWYVGKKFEGDSRIPDTKLSGYIQGSVATKIEAERSKWTVSTSSKGRITIGGSQENPQEEEVWTFSTAEYEESTLRFLTPPEAEMYAKWETSDNKHEFTCTSNNKIYSLSTLQADDGTYYPGITVEAATNNNLFKVAQLNLAGVTSFKTYYVTATLNISGIDSKRDVKPEATLGTKDETPETEFDFEGIDLDWLYTGYSVTQINKENFTVNHTWTGIPDDLGGWLDVLYGQNRMKIPPYLNLDQPGENNTSND